MMMMMMMHGAAFHLVVVVIGVEAVVVKLKNLKLKDSSLYMTENIYWPKIEVAVRMWLMTVLKIYEPVHEISNNVLCATSKASDQPAHMRSLIRAFASRLSIL